MNETSRRAEVLQKSAVLFRQRGYAATSIRDIAQAMGMKSPSLYNHIKSKEEILGVLLLSMAELYVKGIQNIIKSDAISIDKLEAIIKDHIRITIQHTDAVSLIPSDWIHLDADSKSRFIQFRETYDKSFREALGQSISDGFLKPIDLEIATFSILSTLRWLFSWYNKNTSFPTDKLEHELIQNLIGGLRG